jgi:hypothetical protein
MAPAMMVFAGMNRSVFRAPITDGCCWLQPASRAFTEATGSMVYLHHIC